MLKKVALLFVAMLSSEVAFAELAGEKISDPEVIQGGARVVCLKQTRGALGFLVLQEGQSKNPEILPRFSVLDNELVINLPMVFFTCLNVNEAWKNVVIDPRFEGTRVPRLHLLTSDGLKQFGFSPEIGEVVSDPDFVHVYPVTFVAPMRHLLNASEKTRLERGAVITKHFRIQWGGSRGYFDIWLNISR